MEQFPVEPKYRKDNGLVLQDIDREDLPLGFKPISRSLITISPKQAGGNHKHVRIEAFIGIGAGLEIIWVDEQGERHSELMNSDDKLRLFVVDSMVPHAIRNNGDVPAVVLEYADLPQEKSPVEFVEVVKVA